MTFLDKRKPIRIGNRQPAANFMHVEKKDIFLILLKTKITDTRKRRERYFHDFAQNKDYGYT